MQDGAHEPEDEVASLAVLLQVCFGTQRGFKQKVVCSAGNVVGILVEEQAYNWRAYSPRSKLWLQAVMLAAVLAIGHCLARWKVSWVGEAGVALALGAGISAVLYLAGASARAFEPFITFKVRRRLRVVMLMALRSVSVYQIPGQHHQPNSVLAG